jgi:hypothetical protein
MTADVLSNFIGMTLQATGNNNNASGLFASCWRAVVTDVPNERAQ